MCPEKPERFSRKTIAAFIGVFRYVDDPVVKQDASEGRGERDSHDGSLRRSDDLRHNFLRIASGTLLLLFYQFENNKKDIKVDSWELEENRTSIRGSEPDTSTKTKASRSSTERRLSSTSRLTNIASSASGSLTTTQVVPFCRSTKIIKSAHAIVDKA
jgi:hypothetical protein